MDEQQVQAGEEQVSEVDASLTSFVSEAEKLASNILGMIKELDSLKIIAGQVSSILSSPVDSNQKVSRISAILTTGDNPYTAEEVAAEQKPEVSKSEQIKETTNQIAKSSIDAMAVAMAIPILISNPEIVNTVKGFFTGFLEGIGLSNEAIEKIKPILAIALGVLATYWTLGALSNVVTAFEKMMELAKLLGIAGQDVGESADKVEKKDKDVKKKEKDVKAESDKINKEKDDLKKGSDKAKDEIKSSKKEIKKAKRAGAKSKTRIGKFIDKFGYLMEKVTPKLAGLGKNIAKALPFVGTVLGIGLILYDIYSIGSDIYDVFFGNDDEKDEAEEVKPEQKPVVASTAAPASSTLGTQSTKSTTPPTTTSKPTAAATEPKLPTEVERRSEQQAEPKTPSLPAPDVTTASAPASTSTSKMAAEPSQQSKDVIESSRVVDTMERDMERDSGSVTVVVNNNNIVTNVKKQPAPAAAAVYSVTVGA